MNWDELEAKIAMGDRDAMAQYLAASLSQNLTKAELRRRYSLVWEADHGNDTMVLRNLAIIAAAAGEFKKTAALAQDLLLESFFADALHSALALRNYGKDEQRSQADEIISRLASLGHIRSQVLVRSFSSAEQGIFKKFGFQVFRIFKILYATALFAKNPNDPRISV